MTVRYDDSTINIVLSIIITISYTGAVYMVWLEIVQVGDVTADGEGAALGWNDIDARCSTAVSDAKVSTGQRLSYTLCWWADGQCTWTPLATRARHTWDAPTEQATLWKLRLPTHPRYAFM